MHNTLACKPLEHFVKVAKLGLTTIPYICIVIAMITVPESDINQHKLARLTAAWREVLVETLQRGFYGSATIELVVHDGTITQIRKKVERMEK